MKAVFFGTPEAAVPFLEKVAADCEVGVVVTRPDRPRGRGLEVSPPPVKRKAGELGLPVLQPESLDAGFAAQLRSHRADLAVVVAFGALLPEDLLDACKLGFLNVHFSLLPKYRGAAPVAWTLLNGDTVSGVTLFWIDKGMDTGPVFSSRKIPVYPEDDATTLQARLVELGVGLLGDALKKLAKGGVVRKVQQGEPIRAPRLKAEDGLVSFGRPSLEVHNRIRAMAGGPLSAYVLVRARSNEGRAAESAPRVRLNLLKSSLEAADHPAVPGTILRVEKSKGLLVQCSPGSVWIGSVQPEGKRVMGGADFSNGMRLKAGDPLI